MCVYTCVYVYICSVVCMGERVCVGVKRAYKRRKLEEYVELVL